jgi:hypothetical protein
MSARWGDELAPAGDDAPTDDGREEPTLRELVAGALFAADFRVMRGAWPLDRGAFLNEVSVGPVFLDRGWEVCSVSWQGAAKGSAIARHAGAFHAARLALEAAGLTVEHAGGLRLEVGWQGDPVGSAGRTARVRAEMAAGESVAA